MAKKRQTSQFVEYVSSLPEDEQNALSGFFRKLDQHLQLSANWKRQIIRDFENAILYYAKNGRSVEAIMELLDPRKLGGFYSREATAWYPLDSAAKVYPLSMGYNKMAVFRLSVYLEDEVVPELLQMALTFTIKRFPFFATTIKSGIFWHYIDSTKTRFPVERETEFPCAPMNVSRAGSPSFRVLYYRNRISCEFFHILTDGTGGMAFLKSLTAEYLRLCGCDVPPSHGVLDIDDIPDAKESADDFGKCVSGRKSSGFVDKPALQMGGKLSKIKPCQIIHFDIPADKLISFCHEKNCSVTALFVALMFIAVKASTDERYGTVNIQVPVNMRRFYESRTLRNFALYVGIRLTLEEITTLEDILPEVSDQLNRRITPDTMQEMMNGAVKLVHSLRFIPLFVKAPVARVVYGFLGDRVFTTVLSNLGRVDMPDEMARHVRKMDFVLGTVNISRAACSMVTAGNICTFSIAKLTADPSFEERMFKLLCENGLEPHISGSGLYGV